MNNFQNNFYNYPMQDNYIDPYNNQDDINRMNHFNMNFKTPHMPNYKNQNVFNPKEGFIRGNLFSDLYKPYLEKEPFTLSENTERERSLNKLNELAFAAHELNLYLDVFPKDEECIRLFNTYRVEAQRARKAYEDSYGPITINSDTLNNYPFLWINEPWPWEGVQ